jgi:hypothetical protein
MLVNNVEEVALDKSGLGISEYVGIDSIPFN